MFKKGVVLCLTAFYFSIISTALALQKDSERIISESLIVHIDSSSVVQGSFKVSPDSKRVAYVAKAGDKWLVVIGGKEGKQYDGIGRDSINFSPDSKRLAYGAFLEGRGFVVLDGEEGKAYDGIITSVGGRIIFDSPETLRYLAVKGSDVYLVEEKIAR